MKKMFVTLLNDGLKAESAVRMLLKTGFPAKDLKLAVLNPDKVPAFGDNDCGGLELVQDLPHLSAILQEGETQEALLQLANGLPVTPEQIDDLLAGLDRGACLLIVEAALDQLGFIQQVLRDSVAEDAGTANVGQGMPTAVVHYLVGRRSQESGGAYVPSPQERQRMIAEAAYFRAQARGFGEDRQLDDWLAAEREIQQRLEAEPAKSAGQMLRMPLRKVVSRNLGMAERRAQPESHREPERRRTGSVGQPAMKQQ